MAGIVEAIFGKSPQKPKIKRAGTGDYHDTPFDPDDPKWAKNFDEFPPDKKKLWKHGPESDGWVLAHNSLRCELDSFADALDATIERLEKGSTGPVEWEIKCIQKWWPAHVRHETSHSQIAADHTILRDHIEKISGFVDNLSSDNLKCVQDLSKAYGDYVMDIKAHLLEEEVTVVALQYRYFTPKEIGKKTEEILSKSDAPKEEMGAFIYWMGEQKFRREFMKQEGIPFFVWWIGGFKSKRDYYIAEVLSQVDALSSGEPPMERACGWCSNRKSQ